MLRSCASSLGPRVLAPEPAAVSLGLFCMSHFPCSHGTSQGFGRVLLGLFEGCQGQDLCPWGLSFPGALPEVRVAIISAEAPGTLQSSSAQALGPREGGRRSPRRLPQARRTLGEVLKREPPREGLGGAGQWTCFRV